jgi:phospholipid-binding lipoprotein MlaA
MKKLIVLNIIISVLLIYPHFINATEQDEDLMDMQGYEYTENVDYKALDPLEPMNRVFFGFNHAIDDFALRPLAILYKEAVPYWGRERVSHFVGNLNEPVNIVNALLQGDEDKFAHATGRFLINSIIGIGGLFDVAGLQDELKPVKENFGRTLSHYGVETGPYLVLPIIGPSSFRDAPALAVDYFTSPFHYFVEEGVNYGEKGLELVDTRSSRLEVTDDIAKTSLDEYATYRSIYFQKRK